jgi:hypothetical protein
MGADKNSTQELAYEPNFTRTPPQAASFSFQVHVATGVLLDLGARSNQQILETRSRKQLKTAAGNQNRSGRFLKPVRPTFWDLASHRQGNRLGHFCPGNAQKTIETKPDPKHLKNPSTFEQE